jgi:hypothetical protein
MAGHLNLAWRMESRIERSQLTQHAVIRISDDACHTQPCKQGSAYFGDAPVVGVLVRREGERRGADGAGRHGRGRLDEAPRVGERGGAARAQEDQRRRRYSCPRSAADG